MFINKVGFSHWEIGRNNHDYGVDTPLLKCVVDGCSEGEHSEVGGKLYTHLMKSLYSKILTLETQFFNSVIFERFKKLIDMGVYDNKEYAKTILNYFLFTILLLKEQNDSWEVETCGDGIIIKQTWDDKFEYEIIEQNGKPKYYAYNFVPKEFLTDYQDGVGFETFVFSKKDYKAIGLASDGLSYILNSEFKEEFEEYLRDRKEVKIKRLINREHRYFKDDITIII